MHPYRQIFLQVRGEYWKRRRIKLVKHIVANLNHDWLVVVVIGTEPGLMVGEPTHPGLGLEVVQKDRNSRQIVDRTEFGKSPKPKLTQPTKKSSLVSSLWRLLLMFMVVEEQGRISKESKSAYFLTDSLIALEICFNLPMIPVYFLKNPLQETLPVSILVTHVFVGVLVSQVHVGYAMLDPQQETLPVSILGLISS